MQFVWPIKADYRIMYVSPEYDFTIVGRQKRDYVWIMARTPTIPEPTYQALVAMVEREGYDVAKIERVPQRWPLVARWPVGCRTERRPTGVWRGQTPIIGALRSDA